jgi:peptidyl-prolyl cis-trans isomerase D
MIRFLQRDNRFTKAFFFVVIAAASVGMVVYLIPGLTGMGASTADTYATIYPHWYSRIFSSGVTISQQTVSQRVSRQLQSNPSYADNPMIVHYFEQQAGQQLVQQQVLLAEAEKLGIVASEEDVSNFLHKGQFGEVLFPHGEFIGKDHYADFIARQFNMSVPAFEQEVKQEVIIRRLRALIAASAKVSDAEVRTAYFKQNVKIKFDYAVIASDALKDSIKPTDAELEAFFKRNAARFAASVPEQRQVTYFSFGPSNLPGGVPQVSQQEIQQYFQQHQEEYTVPEQARSRHILIKVAAGADAKTDAAAKAKAEGLLKQIQGGANFADLAAKNSQDPGSKDNGGELGFINRNTPFVPEFLNAVFSQKIGDTQIVKSSYGYHIIQVEERQAKHALSLAEVAPTIQITLIRKKAAAAEENFAQALTSEAIKNGLEKTAAAHHLQFTTTPMVGEQGVISAFADSSQVLGKAFAAKRGDPPQFASTGEGYAIFQVTGISPAHAPAFADWKTGGVRDYQNEQLPILLTQKTQELANKAKASGDLAKAAKEVGATFKTSELVSESGQVPDMGAVGQVAPQLFDLKIGDLSGPINAGRTGVVAKLVDKQEPSADELAKNLDRTRDELLEQRQNETFVLFLNSLMEDYKKHNRIWIPKAKAEETPAS